MRDAGTRDDPLVEEISYEISSSASVRSPYIYRGSSLPPFGGVGSLAESELGRTRPARGGGGLRRPSRVGARQLRRPVRDANSERINCPPPYGGRDAIYATFALRADLQLEDFPFGKLRFGAPLPVRGAREGGGASLFASTSFRARHFLKFSKG